MFTLEPEAIDAVIACQHSVGRQEICGLCAVDAAGTQHFIALTNHSFDPHRFETSASDEALVGRVLRQRGWSVLAFVHTHLWADPEMSDPDAWSFAHDSLPWVIVMIRGGRVEQRTFGLTRM
jgi:proteasome lid subunit RPN8/RPN11